MKSASGVLALIALILSVASLIKPEWHLVPIAVIVLSVAVFVRSWATSP